MDTNNPYRGSNNKQSLIECYINFGYYCVTKSLHANFHFVLALQLLYLQRVLCGYSVEGLHLLDIFSILSPPGLELLLILFGVLGHGLQNQLKLFKFAFVSKDHSEQIFSLIMINHQLMWYLIINYPIIISFKLVMSSDKWQCQSPLSQKPEIGSGQASLLHNGVYTLVNGLSISGIGLPLHIDSFCICGPVTSYKMALIL